MLAELSDDHFYVTGDAVFLVDGDGKSVQVDQSLVVGDGVDPALVVFPGTDDEGHGAFPNGLVDAGDGIQKSFEGCAIA